MPTNIAPILGVIAKGDITEEDLQAIATAVRRKLDRIQFDKAVAAVHLGLVTDNDVMELSSSIISESWTMSRINGLRLHLLEKTTIRPRRIEAFLDELGEASNLRSEATSSPDDAEVAADYEKAYDRLMKRLETILKHKRRG